MLPTPPSGPEWEPRAIARSASGVWGEVKGQGGWRSGGRCHWCRSRRVKASCPVSLVPFRPFLPDLEQSLLNLTRPRTTQLVWLMGLTSLHTLSSRERAPSAMAGQARALEPRRARTRVRREGKDRQQVVGTVPFRYGRWLHHFSTGVWQPRAGQDPRCGRPCGRSPVVRSVASPARREVDDGPTATADGREVAYRVHLDTTRRSVAPPSDALFRCLGSCGPDTGSIGRVRIEPLANASHRHPWSLRAGQAPKGALAAHSLPFSFPHASLVPRLPRTL